MSRSTVKWVIDRTDIVITLACSDHEAGKRLFTKIDEVSGSNGKHLTLTTPMISPDNQYIIHFVCPIVRLFEIGELIHHHCQLNAVDQSLFDELCRNVAKQVTINSPSWQHAGFSINI